MTARALNFSVPGVPFNSLVGVNALQNAFQDVGELITSGRLMPFVDWTLDLLTSVQQIPVDTYANGTASEYVVLDLHGDHTDVFTMPKMPLGVERAMLTPYDSYSRYQNLEVVPSFM